MCKILFNEEGDFHSGALILVDKPLKWTSFDVVNKIRWCLKSACGKIKVGHAGTLDPLATGLVIVSAYRSPLFRSGTGAVSGSHYSGPSGVFCYPGRW